MVSLALCFLFVLKISFINVQFNYGFRYYTVVFRPIGRAYDSVRVGGGEVDATPGHQDFVEGVLLCPFSLYGYKYNRRGKLPCWLQYDHITQFFIIIENNKLLRIKGVANHGQCWHWTSGAIFIP